MRTTYGTLDHATDSSLEDKARRAAKRARKLLSTTWRPYLRMLTGNPKLNVRLTGGTPRTDGNTVYLRVPAELGETLEHDEPVCGKRDLETMVQECNACASDDRVFAVIYHEAAHMVFESFQSVSTGDRSRAFADAVRLSCEGDEHSKRAKRVKLLLNDPAYDVSHGYMPLASAINPFLPGLLNAAEDTRVNNAMTEARPGVGKMLDALFYEIFVTGMEQPDGTVLHWSDQPLNAQASIAVFCESSGLKWRDHLSSEVVTAFDDPVVQAECDALSRATSVRITFKHAVVVLERLRQLGFFEMPEDEEDEPGDGEGEGGKDGESEESEPGEGSGSGSGGGGAKSDKDDGDGETGDSEDGESGDGKGGSGTESTGKEAEDDAEKGDGSGPDGDFGDEATDDGSAKPEDGSSDDESDGGSSEGGPDVGKGGHMGTPDEVSKATDVFTGHDEDQSTSFSPPPSDEETPEVQEVERQLVQEEHFDKSSRLGKGLAVVQYDDRDERGTAWDNYGGYAESFEDPDKTLISPALQRARIVFDENKRGKTERNLKSGHRLDGRVLATRVAVDDPRVFTRRTQAKKRDYGIVIGLDCSGSTYGQRIQLIKQMAMAWAELLNHLGIKFAVYGHSGDHTEATIFSVKEPEERWNEAARDKLRGLGPYSANLDGHTLEFYRKTVDRLQVTDKMIIYVTDGAMPAENYAEELEVLQENIKICQRRGIKLVAIGVENDDPTAHGLDTIRVDGIEDLSRSVAEIEKRLE